MISECPTTRQLVCGNDGITYDNVCRAGGPGNVAHDDACAGFVCGGVVCAAGFRCHGSTVFGAPVDQCVPASDGPAATLTATAAPAAVCSCPAGFHCRQDPSGPFRCEADAPPPPAPADVCSGFACPAGTRCVVQLVFGAPTPACQ